MIKVIVLSFVSVTLFTFCDCVGEIQFLEQVLSNCRKGSPNFDDCLLHALNNLRPLFKTGIPEYNVAPFDPHHSLYVEQHRGGNKLNYKLVLTDVSEHGWIISNITKLRTDAKRDQIIYSQYFPEKTLDGQYDIVGTILGSKVNNRGPWNITLYDYSQTTTVTRVGGVGGLIKVRVEIDHIGGMVLHIGNLLGGKTILEKFADSIINSSWQLGFPFLRPLINELVSTAFTDIFTESFRHFPINNFIK